MDFKVTTFFEVEYLKNKVTVAQEETISNIWNGAMFRDLDWPQNARVCFFSLVFAVGTGIHFSRFIEGGSRKYEKETPQVPFGELAWGASFTFFLDSPSITPSTPSSPEGNQVFAFW